MGKEIEAKYLLREDGVSHSSDAFRAVIREGELEERILAEGVAIRQGYLPIAAGRNLGTLLGLPVDSMAEARLRERAGIYSFTLKSDGTLSRDECEARIEERIFLEYWPQTEGRRIAKVRMGLPWCGFTAELDAYTDRDLIVAEVEVPSMDALASIVPLGKDISGDARYKNKNLAK